MLSKKGPKLTWRPTLEWGRCRDGYAFTEMDVSHPDFPQHLRWQAPAGKLTFIRPKSLEYDRYERLNFGGFSELVYQDFANINADFKSLNRFIDKYGLLYHKGYRQDNYALPLIVAEHIINDVHKVRSLLEVVASGDRYNPDASIINKKESIVKLNFSEYNLSIEARFLSDFIYWQIILMMLLGKDIVKCEICGNYMSPLRKTRMRFCGSTCRSRHNRSLEKAALAG